MQFCQSDKIIWTFFFKVLHCSIVGNSGPLCLKLFILSFHIFQSLDEANSVKATSLKMDRSLPSVGTHCGQVYNSGTYLRGRGTQVYLKDSFGSIALHIVPVYHNLNHSVPHLPKQTKHRHFKSLTRKQFKANSSHTPFFFSSSYSSLGQNPCKIYDQHKTERKKNQP